MCGIIGCVGHREAEPVLLEGLGRLEYRGYDSAGLATLAGKRLNLRKRAGRFRSSSARLRMRPARLRTCRTSPASVARPALS